MSNPECRYFFQDSCLAVGLKTVCRGFQVSCEHPDRFMPEPLTPSGESGAPPKSTAEIRDIINEALDKTKVPGLKSSGMPRG